MKKKRSRVDIDIINSTLDVSYSPILDGVNISINGNRYPSTVDQIINECNEI